MSDHVIDSTVCSAMGLPHSAHHTVHAEP